MCSKSKEADACVVLCSTAASHSAVLSCRAAKDLPHALARPQPVPPMLGPVLAL